MSSQLLSNAEKKAKKAEDYTFFGSVNLASIRENIGEILKLIGRDGIFREYTLHDANHIDSMLALVDKLIPNETAMQMKTADWLMIVLSCYFHDLGMLVTKDEFENRNNCPEFIDFKTKLLTLEKGEDYEEALEKLNAEEREEFLYQEFVRENHAKRIFSWIQGQSAPQYGDARKAVAAVNELLSGLEQVVRDDLARICLSHHEYDLYDLDKYQVNRVYADDLEGEANLHYAALILRTADVLQIQKKRVPPVLYKLIDPSNPKSQEEWAKQAGVRSVKPKRTADGKETDTIEVHASFDKERAYFGLLAYLQQYAGKELERCYDWARQAQKIKGATFEFPWKLIDSAQVEPRGFEGRSYSFKLNQEKILKLLTGHTLYDDPRVAIREVLQNALDAVRFRKYLYKDEPMGKIEIIWDSKNRILTVRDTGIGMTQDIIEKFLLNVGSSYYQSETFLQKHTGFSSISRFGIGILSTFMIADEVQILTVNPDEEFARRLVLPSVVKNYLIKKIPKGDPDVKAIGQHGTEVILHLRRSAELKDIEAVARFWLVIPKCEVTCKTNDSAPVSIGFESAEEVLDYYYQQEKIDSQRQPHQIRTGLAPGIELAYIVEKSYFSPTWEFVSNRSDEIIYYGISDTDKENDDGGVLLEPPGMCVEGVRIRSVPAGYDQRNRSPWIFANLTGREAPKTNVARSDVEQTPELDNALFKIYSVLGEHIQSEFNRMLDKKIGLVEAAWEADFLRTWGLERSYLSSPLRFRDAMSEIQTIAFENENSCQAISLKELDKFQKIWSVDGRLIRNLEGICGILGIDQPAGTIINNLGSIVKPAIPEPRFLGISKSPILYREITKIMIYPEEKSDRIDICWEMKESERWIKVPKHLLRDYRSRVASRETDFESILITRDPAILSECQDYDMIVWRDWCLIMARSSIVYLLDIFGMNETFISWLSILIYRGYIPQEMQSALHQQLVEAKGIDGEKLLPNLILPFERRFGYVSGENPRRDHIFSGFF